VVLIDELQISRQAGIPQLIVLNMDTFRPAAAKIGISMLLWLTVMPADGAVIFMYHHFGRSDLPSTNVRLEQFEAHLEYLQRAGYQILPLEEIVQSLRQHRPLPDRSVAITIDDAYLSVYTEAYPRLRRRHWPFTVFTATDPVDHHFPAFMNWQKMREMQQHGASFANHSSHHEHLIRQRSGESRRQWRTRIRQDIHHAQQRLRTELGQTPMLFAYPYGEYNRDLAELVTGMGFTAFGQQSGAIGPSSDWRALPRYPMSEAFAELADFRIKAASLALPVVDVMPWDPELSVDRRPLMTITLADSNAQLPQLSCYVSGQGAVAPHWLQAKRRFAVQARAALPPGRSRYNCTAPSARSDRYYWFSHLWILPPALPKSSSEGLPVTAPQH